MTAQGQGTVNPVLDCSHLDRDESAGAIEPVSQGLLEDGGERENPGTEKEAGTRARAEAWSRTEGDTHREAKIN